MTPQCLPRLLLHTDPAAGEKEAAGGDDFVTRQRDNAVDNEKVRSHCGESSWVYNSLLTVAMCGNG